MTLLMIIHTILSSLRIEINVSPFCACALLPTFYYYPHKPQPETWTTGIKRTRYMYNEQLYCYVSNDGLENLFNVYNQYRFY